MASSMRTQSAISSLKSYFSKNKKVIICTFLAFFVGVVAGIISCIRSVDGEFERVARADMEFGAAKVFFISLLPLIGGYFVILIAGINSKTVFLIFLPFLTLGFMCGDYSCALIARYESLGLVNLLLIYLPFFLATLVCFVISSVSSLSPDCSCASKIKPSVLIAIKVLCVNVAIAFVLFLVVGSIFGVIIVKSY